MKSHKTKTEEYLFDGRIFAGKPYLIHSDRSKGTPAFIQLCTPKDRDYMPMVFHSGEIVSGDFFKKHYFYIIKKGDYYYTDGITSEMPSDFKPLDSANDPDYQKLIEYKFIDLHNTKEGIDHIPNQRPKSHRIGHLWKLNNSSIRNLRNNNSSTSRRGTLINQEDAYKTEQLSDEILIDHGLFMMSEEANPETSQNSPELFYIDRSYYHELILKYDSITIGPKFFIEIEKKQANGIDFQKVTDYSHEHTH